MAAYFMFGKYSSEALKNVSEKRTTKALSLVKKLGGQVKDVYALLGGSSDLVIVVDMPSVEDAMKASLSLSQLTGISFTTCPAVKVDEFDKLASAL
jgi:uncharacterized protein with GYD domain